MTYIKDLTEYTYGRIRSDKLAIGWLDSDYAFEVGETSKEFKVALELKTTTNVSAFYRGTHDCQFCKNKHPYKGNGTVFVSHNDKTYAAPAMIYHYVEKHNYKPPQEFIDAVLYGK